MNAKVMVVDDKQMMRDSIAATLQRAGHQVVAAADGNAALGLVGRHRPEAVVTDLKMPEMDGLELLNKLLQADDQLPVVVMTAYGTIETAVAAMKQGAFDFIQKPFEGDRLVMTIQRAVEHRRLVKENAVLKSQVRGMQPTPVMVGRSPLMRQLAQQIQRMAESQGTVLVCGDSGTGKEVVARTIHAMSPRRDRAMMCVNCAALSSGLLESELFGHERGAFTGADQMRKGRFELADGGTLLLDEVSEITPHLQAKLLRVLQERQFERVGSSQSMQVDVRVIATTNRDLPVCVAEKTFRGDLYYRLNVLPIHLPPLRQRTEDIPDLAEHFLSLVARREGREPKRFDDGAVELLKGYSWPGNVRELQNICERASVLSKEPVITSKLIGPWLVEPFGLGVGHPETSGIPVRTGAPPTSSPVGVSGTSGVGGVGVSGGVKKLEDLEREQIIRTLGQLNGNRQKTAEALGIGVRTLGLKLKKWKEQRLVAETI